MNPCELGAKTRDQSEAREITQRSAGKHVTGAKRGKTRNRRQMWDKTVKLSYVGFALFTVKRKLIIVCCSFLFCLFVCFFLVLVEKKEVKQKARGNNQSINARDKKLTHN